MTPTPEEWYEFRNALYAGDFAIAEELLSRAPALLHFTNSLGETVLHFLAVEDDLEGVQWLRSHGGDLNSRNTFGTPLIFEVAQVASEKLFAWLVEHGADARALDLHGQDIIEYLEQFDHDDRIAWVRPYVV